MTDEKSLDQAVDTLVSALAEVFAHTRPEWVERLKTGNLDRWSEVLVEVLEDEYSFETKLINQIIQEE